jgi:hypothetical protein
MDLYVMLWTTHVQPSFTDTETEGVWEHSAMKDVVPEQENS